MSRLNRRQVLYELWRCVTCKTLTAWAFGDRMPGATYRCHVTIKEPGTNAVECCGEQYFFADIQGFLP